MITLDKYKQNLKLNVKTVNFCNFVALLKYSWFNKCLSTL